jgi:hypothetical protein
MRGPLKVSWNAGRHELIVLQPRRHCMALPRSLLSGAGPRTTILAHAGGTAGAPKCPRYDPDPNPATHGWPPTVPPLRCQCVRITPKARRSLRDWSEFKCATCASAIGAIASPRRSVDGAPANNPVTASILNAPQRRGMGGEAVEREEGALEWAGHVLRTLITARGTTEARSRGPGKGSDR